MKHFSLFQSLPDFFQNKRLTLLAVWVTVMALFGTVLAFKVKLLVGIVWVIIILCALVFVFHTLKIIGNDTQKYIAGLSYRVNRGEQEAIIKMPLGVILYNEEFEIDWVNPFIQRISKQTNLMNQNLNKINFDLFQLVKNSTIEDCDAWNTIDWLNYTFEIQVQVDLRVIYLRDVTKIAQVQRKYEASHLFIGIVSLDNFDEISERLNDVESSALRSHVTAMLTDWMGKHKIYVRSLASDKYMLIGYYQGLRLAEKDKFNILKSVREDTSSQNMPLTLSIGISYHDEDVITMAKAAQIQLDLALGRGGDQVVVKSPHQDARFYGGTTNPMAKRTRVRARVISHALSELMNSADQVFVMGHSHGDRDSMGAALGVRRLAKMIDKPVWIVSDPDIKRHTDMQILYDAIYKDDQTSDALIKPSEVLSRATKNSLLIMVDHSKRSITESKEVYDILKERLVIIDHHRRGEEFPEKSLLVYIEPYASSTSELVTELFEYQSRNYRGLSRIEATALLAGIQLDTKSFTVRSGTRTFDAASYLRSVGSDGKLIQDFMKDSREDYRQRADLISRAQFLNNDVVVVADDKKIYDSVSVAQAADSLLQIVGVERSFVVARCDEQTISISARSNGDKNVQIIMEKLGGGGHLSFAATQIKEVDTDEAGQQLYTVLKDESLFDEEE